MKDYQKKLWNEMIKNPDRKVMVYRPRQSGKSVFAQVVSQWNDMLEQKRRPVRTLDHAEVDDDLWYVVAVHKEVAEWIRDQNSADWVEEGNPYQPVFEVSSRLYTLLSLKW